MKESRIYHRMNRVFPIVFSIEKRVVKRITSFHNSWLFHFTLEKLFLQKSLHRVHGALQEVAFHVFYQPKVYLFRDLRIDGNLG